MVKKIAKYLLYKLERLWYRIKVGIGHLTGNRFFYDEAFTYQMQLLGNRPNQNTWNAVASLYCHHHQAPPSTQFLETIEGVAGRDKDAKLFEFGCSSGMNLRWFSQRGYGHLAGIDISDVSIELAKTMTSHDDLEKITLTAGNILDEETYASLPREKFDIVFSRATLQHVESADIVPVLRRLRSLLKADGRLIFSECDRPNQPPGRIHGHRVFHTYNHHWTNVLKEAGFTIEQREAGHCIAAVRPN